VKLTAANTNSIGDVVISLNTAFDANTSVATSTNNGLHFTGSSSTSFSYKVGAGTDATKDIITVSVDGINAANLALTGTDITTTATADAASDLISTAIDTLNTARSRVGAYQNRLEFASANLSSAIENSEAARSNLLDLDIAQEMTTFTSKQILTQAGVSMLAQANQMPQNLLKLFQ
jgi:flagellin